MAKVKGRKVTEENQEQKKLGDPESTRRSVRAYFRKELDVDVIKVFEKLKNIAEVPADEINDRMTLARHINSASKNAWRANLLALKATTERELFRLEMDAALRKLTIEATEVLKKEMERKEITKKQITVAMVDQELATREDYQVLKKKEQEIREMRDACQSLAQQWSDRKGLLQTQARLITNEREVRLGGMDRVKTEVEDG